MHGPLQNLTLFTSVQGFKFNVSSVVKFFCFPVCWYNLMRERRMSKWEFRFLLDISSMLFARILHIKGTDKFNTFVQF